MASFGRRAVRFATSADFSGEGHARLSQSIFIDSIIDRLKTLNNILLSSFLKLVVTMHSGLAIRTDL